MSSTGLSRWQLASGAVLAGRFQLQRVLGQGASGVVCEARDLSCRELVALKLLTRDDSGALSQLKREFRALQEIAHPNLIAMYELFAAPAQPCFFTMERLHALTFLEYVRPGGGDCDEPRLRASLVQLALGVQHLHVCGKLHCDLKPSNVLLTAAGHLRIVDFGLVEALAPRTAATGLRAHFAGTPAYAAPEQADPGRRGPSCDWYAVGVMLYEALYGCRPFHGNEPAVLAEKATCAATFPTHLDGPPPSAALTAICRALLEREPARRADGAALLAALGQRRPAASRSVTGRAPMQLVGREQELLQLQAAHTRHDADRPAGLIVRGASGLGKTALCAAYLAIAREREACLVFRARCFVREALHFNALDGIIDELASYLRGLCAAQREALLPPDFGLLTRVFPVFERVSAGTHSAVQDPGLPAADLRVLAFAALRELLRRLAERVPVVLFIDDLQWADQDSARLLQELVRPVIPGLWLLAAQREPESPEPAFSAQLSVLALGPLSDAAIRQIVEHTAHARLSDAQITAICRRAEGHPLWVRALLWHAAERSPHEFSIERALRERFARLSHQARAVLELVSLAGQRVPRALVFRACLSANQGALLELRACGVVRESLLEGEFCLEPYHDVVREVVSNGLDELRRQRLHGSLADALAADGDASLERVVQHYFLANRASEGAPLAERAARIAASKLAFHNAASLLELALTQASDRAEQHRLSLAAAEACDRAGLTLNAARHYERAVATLRAPAQTPAGARSWLAADLELRALVSYCASGHAREARDHLRRLSDALALQLDFAPVSRARVLVSFAIMLLTDAPFLRSGRSADGPESRALRLLWRAVPALFILEPELAAHFTARALASAARLGQRAVYAQALAVHMSLLSLILGRRSALIERQFVRAHKLIAADGDSWERAFVQVTHGLAALLSSEFERARAMTLEIAQRRELDTPYAALVRSCARSVALVSLHNLGRVALLAELGDKWIRDACDAGDRHMEVGLRVVAAQRYLREDDAARAVAELRRVEQIELAYTHIGLTDPWWEAYIWLYRGEPLEALAVCERKRPHFDYCAAHSDPTRVEWLAIEGACAAALLARGLRTDASLRALTRCARDARRARSTLAAPVAAQLLASLRLVRGQRSAACRALRTAIALRDRMNTRLHAASLRLALASLQPALAAPLERAALAVFAEEGIVDPWRWAAMLAPSFLEASAPQTQLRADQTFRRG